MATLANNIRSRLGALGMTQKELADAAGISQVMVHKLLSGKSKSTAKILDIAKALQCDADRLMSGDCSASPEGVAASATPNKDRVDALGLTEEECLEILGYIRGRREP